MMGFTPLERAALRAIFAETPDLAAGLQRQLDVAAVTRRTNTGAGFFPAITVPPAVAPVAAPRVLGRATHARVEGLRHGLGFVLFLAEGRLDCLEGYAYGGDGTAGLDLAELAFTMAGPS